MEPSTTVADRFELHLRVAQSSMGEVYRATDRQTGSAVALKMASAAAGERVLREAQLLRELQHSNVARYVAHGTTAPGTAYLATQWIDGPTLTDRLESGPLGVAATRILLERVASALVSAHERGIVHRDLKPDNLVLHDGLIEGVTLIDFGISLQPLGRERSTLDGTLLGTPGYMAPEQVRDSAHVDTRADMFALGCIAYECLIGKPLFGVGDTMAILARILLEEPPRLDRDPTIPRALGQLVSRLLAKDPAARPTDAHELLYALAELSTASETPLSLRRPREGWTSTSAEQRLLSVLLVADALPLHSAPARATVDVAAHAGSAGAELRARIEDIVVEYDGLLEVLVGGSLVITFAGYEVANDQAAQAARCAAALRRHLPGAKMAIATGGGARVGNYSTGQVLDHAAKLLASAEPGQVSLDETSAGLVRGYFEVVLGTADAAFLGDRSTASRPRTKRGAKPHVGRARELAALQSLWRECTQESEPRLVLITGPAGIGKSRLRHELLDALAKEPSVSSAPNVTVLMGRGDPLRAGTPFGLLADAIGRLCGFGEHDPLEARRRKLTERVSRRLPPAEAKRVSDLMFELVGLPSMSMSGGGPDHRHRDPVLFGDQLRVAWLDWIAHESAAGPLLLVLEDLHWGDLPTVNFVEAMLRELHDRAILVVAVGRLEVHDSFPSLWRSRALEELRLGPLSSRASRQLIEQLAHSPLDAATVEQLAQQGSGNPFFLEALVRGTIAGGGSSPTLRAILQARIERHSPFTRHVLRAASIYGEDFSRGGVAAILGATDFLVLDEALAELSADEIIQPQPQPSDHGGERAWSFRHALWRDAAYEMLTEHDRALGHRLAGAWLAQKGSVELLRLAEHFERGGEPAQAMRYYAEAVEQSLAGHDFAAAIRGAERAIALGATGHARGRLRLWQAEAHAWRGEQEAVAEHGREALTLLPPGPDWLLAVGLVADAAGKLGQGAVLAWLGEALSGVPSDEGDVCACVRVAAQLLLSDRPALAAGIFRAAEGRAGARPDSERLARAWLSHGRAVQALFVGDLGAYVEHKVATVERFAAAGDRRNECLQRVKLGYAYGEIGAFEKAEATLRAALEAAAYLGLPQVTALAQHNLGRVLAARGALDEAEQVEREALRFYQQHQDRRLEAASLVYLSGILVRRGQLEAAADAAHQSVARAVRQSPAHAHGQAHLASILLLKGEALAALEAGSEGLAILQRIGGMDEGEALLRLAHVEALAAVGRHDEARRFLERAYARLQSRASCIVDPTSRASFLSAVAENARTSALAAKYGLSGS